ncbi:MAG: AAA family ATPase [Fusobacteriaceae bacterium]
MHALLLAESGFGKTTSLKYLNPEETFIISMTTKPLPWKGSSQQYPLATSYDEVATKKFRRLYSKDAEEIAATIKLLSSKSSPFKNIIIDDFNYLMQDFYGENSKTTGFGVFKDIGYFMAIIYKAIEETPGKNFIILAHYEAVKDEQSGETKRIMKTVGKMVKDNITPEGKADIVMFIKMDYNQETEEDRRYFVVNYDGEFRGAKSSDIFVKEDEEGKRKMIKYVDCNMQLIVNAANEYYGSL